MRASVAILLDTLAGGVELHQSIAPPVRVVSSRRGVLRLVLVWCRSKAFRPLRRRLSHPQEPETPHVMLVLGAHTSPGGAT